MPLVSQVFRSPENLKHVLDTVHSIVVIRVGADKAPPRQYIEPAYDDDIANMIDEAIRRFGRYEATPVMMRSVNRSFVESAVSGIVTQTLAFQKQEEYLHDGPIMTRPLSYDNAHDASRRELIRGSVDRTERYIPSWGNTMEEQYANMYLALNELLDD